ncbi:MAG: endonuclease VIII [Planctomycetota bacterium]
MPEGPEIRREADRIAKVLQGVRAEEVWFAFEHLQPWANKLAGRTIEAVESRGKALLTRFEGGVNVYSHNQLYGKWYVRKRGALPKTTRQLRFAVHTESNSALLYSASEIEVLHDGELSSHSFLQKLGPDVLDGSTSRVQVEERLRDRRFSGRSLGALLLDQGLVCGLGNYLRSEILFVANLDADQRPKQLEDGQIATLADAIVTITRRAYRSGGVTNDLDDARRLKAEGETRSQYRHYVFSRAGRPCRLCGEKVRKREAAGRRLYWCPACQG